MRIDASSNLNLIPTATLKPTAGQGEGDFGQMLMDVLKEVNDSQQAAREKGNAFMTGQHVSIDDLMITMEQASTAMQLTMQVRNKVLEAYQEIARMQV